MRSVVGEVRIGLKLRKEMLQKLKNQVQLYLGKETSSLRRYALPYKKDIERARWTISSPQQMVDALLSSDVVLGGDFHAFAQAQRSHLRLLRALAAKKNIVLALECIPSRSQKALDHFLQGRIGEADFLKKVGWHSNWGFPWEQYKPLLELVKKNKGRCVALNQVKNSKSYKSLMERDIHAAHILAKAIKNKKDDELVYVLFGDLHIARAHLQKQIKKKASAAVVSAVYLNPEKLYFQFYKKNQEHKSSIVQFSKREFCLIESPPWVKWQSYLIYLNQNYDQFIDDDDSIDYSEHVHSLVKIIAADFNMTVDDTSTIYSFNDLDFIDILGGRLDKKEFHLVKACVGNDLSFFIPTKNVAFLARGTVNYSAHLAGLLVHAIASRRKRWVLPGVKNFERLIWQEAVAFFLSKLINPNRKAVRLDDLKKQLAAFSPDDKGEEALRLALDQKMQDLLIVYGHADSSRMRTRQSVKKETTYLRAAKILGAMMGEKLYAGYKAGHLSKQRVRKYLEYPLEAPEFYDFYVQALKTVDTIELEPS